MEANPRRARISPNPSSRKTDHAGRVTDAALKTIAAFLNTEGGDLLIGVADDGSVVGIERDRMDNDDKVHALVFGLAPVVRNAVGDRAGTYVDPMIQELEGGRCARGKLPEESQAGFLRWKGDGGCRRGRPIVRSGPGTVKLPPESAERYVETRFTAKAARA